MTGNAPKVTLSEIAEAIIAETYTVLPDEKTTVCQLTLYNGFTVEGYSSCVCPANFDAELGKKYSRERAVNKVWEVLGFRLADKLWQMAQSQPEVLPCEPQPVTPEGLLVEALPLLDLGTRVDYHEQFEGNITEAMYAIVTKCSNPHQVSLTVHAPNGTVHGRSDLALLAHDEPMPAGLQFFARRRAAA